MRFSRTVSEAFPLATCIELLIDAIAASLLIHGDLHAGNLLLDGNERLIAIDPSPAIGEPEQDIGDAAAKNDWGQALPGRVKRLAEVCRADPTKVRAYARLAAWNCGVFHAASRAESPGGVDPDELLEYACTGGGAK